MKLQREKSVENEVGNSQPRLAFQAAAHGVCLVALAVGLTGCNLGKDSAVLMTNTSIGIDLDSKPATASIGYKRFEGTLQPQFEEGQSLPMLSSINFKSDADRLFGVGHSFATGAAAVIMTDGLASGDRPYFGTDIHHGDTLLPGSTSRARRPDVVYTKIPVSQRRRTVFFTDTKLALDVTTSDAAPGVPTGINLGYKRKEFAYAPLVESNPEGTNERAIAMPALLATADTGASVNRTNAQTGVKVAQTFATGSAAIYLAADPGIRKVLGERLITDFDRAQAIKVQTQAIASYKDLLAKADTYYQRANTTQRKDFYSKAKSKGLLDTSDLDPAVITALENGIPAARAGGRYWLPWDPAKASDSGAAEQLNALLREAGL